jgi:hypothetical protein
MPCVSAVWDLAANAWVLTRPLHTVTLPPGAGFPFLVDEIWLNTQLTDAIGTYNLSVQLRMPLTQAILVRSAPTPRSFPTNRMDVVEEAFQLTKVPFRRPGEYEFHMLANQVEIGSPARLLVR